MLITSVSTSVPFISSGQMRGIAVSSTRRMGGPLAQVPTWQELGYQSSGSWKGVMAPKGVTPQQVAFWEDVMRKSSQSDEIVQYAEKNQWILEFKGAAETKKWLDEESAALKATMVALGLLNRFTARGVAVPADISVLGFDDIALAAMVHPSLTTVALPKEQSGRAGVDLLLQLLAEPDRLTAARRELPTQLMVRGSTGPTPA